MTRAVNSEVIDDDRWRAAEQRRRKLVGRLAWELAHPDPDAPPGALNDFVAATDASPLGLIHRRSKSF